MDVVCVGGVETGGKKRFLIRVDVCTKVPLIFSYYI